ncbi:Rhs-family protein [Pseudooceanicola batsensis HTCC2597]|uniref:Rhs-family protein n=1 Tax=Pseudooceanicola batsensis (strain ATCC BAA-863 / DSM 15984 / KCTC 12145 / HTCC2597) TaxID=252305 RepID=A3TYC3_PSEBH|nr:type VI secretion system tip protein TssI/VgrG [Pseudooceanicola batsensis]EAQ03157.1 Rhs-family protein [Pseudooceanicola batsensis HTCC2597]
MPAEGPNLKNRMLRMETALPKEKVFIKNARVSEGLSQLTETRIEFLSNDRNIDLQDFIGTPITIELDEEPQDARHKFSGTCISVEYLGLYQGMLHLVAEVRPWLWYLTRTMNNRIFQEMNAVEIIKSVLGDHGFSGNITEKTQGSYDVRTYCVQYRESDFDFISRLMEEEGIYYYFDQSGKQEKMVIADGISAHSPVPSHAEIDFHYREEKYRRRDDHIFDWSDAAAVTPGKVTLEDYDFQSPRAELKSTKAIAKGKHSHKNYELYDYPGRYTKPALGEKRARVRIESEAVRHLVSRGVGNVRGLRTGTTFKLKGHPRMGKAGKEFLAISTVHLMQIENDYEDAETLDRPFSAEGADNAEHFGPENRDTYRCMFSVIPKSEPFRAPQTTPWPEIAGLQTAMVTGPSGEEIHTDEYGRIKVQFHWDRMGKKDDKTTCWVRCVMPWTGKNWGMIHIPRIGQEVVIQFEEGDPDRPFCTGMLYNGETKPPYALPANMTQTGIVTRSTKSGSASTFNELIFEDKKDAEFVRLQSERDYKETIKNNAEITIGLEHKDKGDLTQTIHRHKTETLNTGDHTFTVKAGNQTVFVKKDHDETIEGKSTNTITGNYTETVKQGNFAQTVKMGNYTQSIDTGNLTRTVKIGNYNETVKTGNYGLKTSLGSISEEALQKIEMKVGANSIKIDQTGVTIKGMMIKIEGTAMLQTKAPMIKEDASAVLILKGGVTMIN